MKNFYVLTDALEFIEQNIQEDITPQDVADYSCVSLSSLQKLFRLALHRSVKDYIVRRRVSLAAKDIQKSDARLIDIAYQYQFGTPESFTRAFRRLWNETPTSYRENWKFSDLWPRLNYHYEEGADEEMARKKVDISEAYEKFRNMKSSIVLCFDIVGLVPINAISYGAGDMAIAQVAKRIDDVCDESMIMMRIGGDEFALMTGLTDEKEASELANRVLKWNGKPIVFDGQEIPLSVRCASIRIPEGNLKYDELFSGMHHAIGEKREQELKRWPI